MSDQQTSDNTYPPSAFSFTVVFEQSAGVSDTSFQEVSGIGPEIETEDVIEGGENTFVHRLPKQRKHPRLVLKRGLAKADSELVSWCRNFLETDFSQPLVPVQLYVRLLNPEGQQIANWKFENAYPVKWEIEAFNAMKNEVAIERIELSYSRSSREN